MKDFVDTCRQGEELRGGLEEKGYLMDNTEMYSIRDLLEVSLRRLRPIAWSFASNPILAGCYCVRFLCLCMTASSW